MHAYHSGKTSPFEKIYFGNYGQVMGVGVDSSDNVWVVSDYGPPYLVFEIPAGTTQINDAGLQDLNLPIGIAFGKHDEMYVSNLESSTVNVSTARRRRIERRSSVSLSAKLGRCQGGKILRRQPRAQTSRARR